MQTTDKNEDAKKYGCDTILHTIAKLHFDLPPIAKHLIEKEGADVNAKNPKGETPLHYTAWNNAVEFAKLLIDHGADINARDVNGETPLHWATQERTSYPGIQQLGAAEVAKLLIDKGATK